MDTGVDESLILCCISSDQKRLIIHEKLKQAFMFLTRVMYIQNEFIAPGIAEKNRCYVYSRLKDTSKDNNGKVVEESMDSEYFVENDFYAGLDRKKKT
jgi:hypothetical protein